MHSTTLITALLFAVLGVRAGSRSWEGGVRLQEPHPVVHIEVDASGHAVKDNITQTSLIEKRWMGITHRGGSARNKRWPDKTISYCYDRTESREKLHEYLLVATQRWQAAGLSAEDYKYVQVADPGSACTKHKQRSSVLVISYNTEGVLRSYMGIPPLNADDPGMVGPILQADTRNDIGMLDAAANIAHELGHVWGLEHEHQNPAFWSYQVLESFPGGQNIGDDWLFSKEQFDCKALKDYERAHARVKVTEPDDVDKLCTTYNVASTHGFSAAEWLPYQSPSLRAGVSGASAKPAGFDWQSIMLYPSGAGGKGPASPPNEGQEMDANDERAPVLKRRDGSKWRGNYFPSEKDITGVRTIYEDSQFPDGEPVLPIDSGHSHQGRFRRLGEKLKCKLSGQN